MENQQYLVTPKVLSNLGTFVLHEIKKKVGRVTDGYVAVSIKIVPSLAEKGTSYEVTYTITPPEWSRKLIYEHTITTSLVPKAENGGSQVREMTVLFIPIDNDIIIITAEEFLKFAAPEQAHGTR